MFERYMTTFNCPMIVVADHGPAFSNNFIEFLHANHIEHHYSSYYRPRSNAPAEKSVRSIKDVLLKIPTSPRGTSELQSSPSISISLRMDQAAPPKGSLEDIFAQFFQC